MKFKPQSSAVIVAALLVVSTLYLNSLVPPTVKAAERPLHVAELSAERYAQSVSFLASDELKGRGNGTPELERAADYIESQFRIAGLKPAGEDNSYFQKFQITTGTEFGPKNTLQVEGSAPLQMNTDFVTIPFSSPADVSGPVVFAGYGITAPEYQWDDYGNIDVTGKIVIVFRHEPEELDAKSKWNGKEFTNHA